MSMWVTDFLSSSSKPTPCPQFIVKKRLKYIRYFNRFGHKQILFRMSLILSNHNCVLMNIQKNQVWVLILKIWWVWVLVSMHLIDVHIHIHTIILFLANKMHCLLLKDRKRESIIWSSLYIVRHSGSRIYEIYFCFRLQAAKKPSQDEFY